MAKGVTGWTKLILKLFMTMAWGLIKLIKFISKFILGFIKRL